MRRIELQHARNHLLMRLDARVKILAALALLIMVLSSHSILFPLVIATISTILCLAIGVRLRLLLVRFAEPLLIALMVLLLKLFFNGSSPLFSFNLAGFSIVAYSEGLREGLLIASRIAGAVSVVAAAGFATPFTEVVGALAWMRLPQGLIEVMVFAWRYLFLLFDDAQVIHAAQRNRLGYAGFRRGLRSFGTLTGALVIKAFDSSQTMTTAMVQRGYDGTLPVFRHKPFRIGELVSVFLLVVFIGFLWGIYNS
jgi:cobalt/nickel transport system permease protein